MSEMMEFRCPYCGGRMDFDSITQKMKCSFCDSTMDVNEYEKRKKEIQGGGFEFENACGGEWQESEITGMRIYVCQSCGGEILAEETTGATTCPYCGNRVVMKEQFSGGLKPDLIIPFRHDKESAKKSYLSHLKGKRFLPKVFKEENHIDEIKGLYVPFWVFDADVSMDCFYKAEQISKWVVKDKEYTETRHFYVDRGGNVSFSKVPADASKKMDDTLMESIEPYEVSKAVPFQASYLSGYIADRYDVEVDERFERAKERIHNSATEVCKHAVKGYAVVIPQSENVRILKSQYHYALFPVWILNTTWRGKKYTFAMNGQTGKMTGDLPVDKGAVARFVALWSVLGGVALYALEWIMVLLM